MRGPVIVFAAVLAAAGVARADLEHPDLPRTPGYARVAAVKTSVAALRAIQEGKPAVREFCEAQGLKTKKWGPLGPVTRCSSDLYQMAATHALSELRANTGVRPQAMREAVRAMTAITAHDLFEEQHTRNFLKERGHKQYPQGPYLSGYDLVYAVAHQGLAAMNPTRSAYLSRSQMRAIVEALQGVSQGRKLYNDSVMRGHQRKAAQAIQGLSPKLLP
jgi:hypothetical protein